MTELELKYGCNPNQKPARIFMEEGEPVSYTHLDVYKRQSRGCCDPTALHACTTVP